MRPLLLLGVLLVCNCAKVLDLEQREVVAVDAGSDGGGVGPVIGELCGQYCLDAKELCRPEQKVSIFETDANCEVACRLYPPGSPDQPTGNTLACRAKLLQDARRIGEAATICQAAGPSGSSSDGTTVSCGTNCESFCNLRQKVCPKETEPDCLRKCQGIPDRGIYNALESFKSDEDTLHCRMAHLVVAATWQAENDEANRENHCKHSGFKSSAPCDIGAMATPKCEDYCKVVNTACTGDVRVYESTEQCMAVCGKLTPGTAAEKTADTLRCRRELAYEALRLEATPISCDAAGPAPIQCGGSKCASYCKLASQACPAAFATAYVDHAGCEKQCALIPDSMANSTYAVPKGVPGDTFACRLLSATQALAGDLRACESAVGLPGGVCKR